MPEEVETSLSTKTSSSAAVCSKWTLIKTFSYGVITGSALLATVRLYQKWRLLDPKQLQLAVLPMLRANREVKQLIGSSLRPGLLSGYSYKGGIRLRIPRFSKRPHLLSLSPITYQSWTLIMLFQVIGEKGSGLVSLEAERRKWRASERETALPLKSLSVDFSDGQRLVLKGDVTNEGGTQPVEYEKLKKT